MVCREKLIHLSAMPALLLGMIGLNPAMAAPGSASESETLSGVDPAAPAPEGNWNVVLGASVAVGNGISNRLTSADPGASTIRAQVSPILLISYRNTFFLTPGGLGANLVNWSGFRAGPLLGYEAGRHEGDNSDLSGLGDIPSSITAGGFAAYRLGAFELSARATQAVTHTGNGLTGTVQLDYRCPIIPGKLVLQAGPDLGFANGRYDRTWFGVTSAQSMQSGLPVYTPGGGVKDAGLHSSLTYNLTDRYLLRGFADVKELVGSDADSPIVKNKTQIRVGIGAAYRF